MSRHHRFVCLSVVGLAMAGSPALAAPSVDEAPPIADNRSKLETLADVPRQTAPSAHGTNRTMQLLLEINKDGKTVVETADPKRDKATQAARHATTTPLSDATTPIAAPVVQPLQQATIDSGRTPAGPVMPAVSKTGAELSPASTRAVIDGDSATPVAMRSGLGLPSARDTQDAADAADLDLRRLVPTRLIRFLRDNRTAVLAASVLVLLVVGALTVSQARRR